MESGQNSGQVDLVSAPPHYITAAGIEAIDVIERYGFDQSFHLGNALKYCLRAGRKAGVDRKQCLEKALWYIDRFQDIYEDLLHDDGPHWPALWEPVENWHSPEEIVAAFGLVDTTQGHVVGSLLDVAIYNDEAQCLHNARMSLLDAIAECA